jgi:hypothetical protein
MVLTNSSDKQVVITANYIDSIEMNHTLMHFSGETKRSLRRGLGTASLSSAPFLSQNTHDSSAFSFEKMPAQFDVQTTMYSHWATEVYPVPKTAGVIK